jgi:hypothetical protein
MYPPMPPGMYPPGPPVPQGMYPPPQPGMSGYNPMASGMRPGVVTAGYNSPTPPAGYSTAMVPNRPLTAPDRPGSQLLPQLLAMMQDSLYPSQREWAAENLATYDWRTHPEIVQALVTSAGKDPAVTMRTCCVRTLAKMNINTMPVITALQGLKSDGDPRVRQAAEDALGSLTPAAEK